MTVQELREKLMGGALFRATWTRMLGDCNHLLQVDTTYDYSNHDTTVRATSTDGWVFWLSVKKDRVVFVPNGWHDKTNGVLDFKFEWVVEE